MNSKLIGSHREFFAPLVVDAVMYLDQNSQDMDLIGIKKQSGGSMEVRLVPFDPTLFNCASLPLAFGQVLRGLTCL